ncbi:MAG: phosphoribosylglycinamide formyltransferase [Gammaproteobacteria bacterium]
MTQGIGHGPSTVVLVSGGGTNLQAIIDRVSSGELGIRLTAVISDVPNAFALERARRAGIQALTVDYRGFSDRAAAETELSRQLSELTPDIIVLAGFMRILPADLVSNYAGRMLNVHPSLLPRHRGLNTYARVLEAGDDWHGSTVHFVVPELDAGPSIIQYRVRVSPRDDASSLQQRVQQGEYQIYSQAIDWLASGRLKLHSDMAWLDGQCLVEPERVVETVETSGSG